MKCPNCETENLEEARFCIFCGCKLMGAIAENKGNGSREEELSVKKRDAEDNHSRLRVASITILIFIAVSIILSVMTVNQQRNSPEQKLKNALVQNNIDRAWEAYDEISSDKDRIKALQEFLDYANDIYMEYAAEQEDVTYRYAVSVVGRIADEYIRRHIPSEEVDEVLFNIERICAGRKYYRDALEAANNGDFETAIADFSRVEDIDLKYYEDAQKRIDELKKQYKNKAVAKDDESLQSDRAAAIGKCKSEVDSLREDVERMISEEAFPEAFERLEFLAQMFSKYEEGNVYIGSTQKDLTQKTLLAYKNYVMREATKYVLREDYEKAVLILRDSQRYMDDTEVNEMIRKYDSK